MWNFLLWFYAASVIAAAAFITLHLDEVWDQVRRKHHARGVELDTWALLIAPVGFVAIPLLNTLVGLGFVLTLLQYLLRFFGLDKKSK